MTIRIEKLTRRRFIQRVRPRDTDDVSISNFAAGKPDHVIYHYNGILHLIDRQGELVAGGSESPNMTDNTDMGEMLEYAVETANMRCLGMQQVGKDD